ncbi:glucuronyl esterase domain-containing protein [Thermoflavifilum thermophilum]|uniref:4-O-methyl-glucuronoyl methylesterase-like domain-containing protein n=1 Tax=Thermoflavifilum thermophilum TaxID=1393122 RepID=A0A1I7MYC8_9BACT|nr:hypothetical protein [Thermoflavifilum thermophilum]SFV27421.1 hypothetical protein SAMN05660895_0107 [Thermoflavifilum thermophilum]
MRRHFHLLMFSAATWAAIAGSARAQQVMDSARLQAFREQQQRLYQASVQDRQLMLAQLGIDSLRPGYDPNPGSKYPPNTDESKANPYTHLPDPLICHDGERVTTPAQWWQKRRPEIVAAFDTCIYGRVPPHAPTVTWRVVEEKQDTQWQIPVITRQVIGYVDSSLDTAIHVHIQLTLTLPAHITRPVPVMMEFGFVFPPGFRLPAFMRDSSTPWQKLVLEQGWGYAILNPTSVQEDNGAGLTRGIIGLCNRGQPRKPYDWGALRAWAWGASRALDYLETLPEVNAHEVGIEGVSRYGKAALVTMAYDQRFAIALIGSSGKGGATLYRRDFGEGMGNLASAAEYHWFCGNFLKYDGPLTANDLPVDAHELIALCAPRPVFISEGSPEVEGNWVDDRGQFMAEVAAGPVYRLLGKKDLGTTKMPPMGTVLISGDLAFRQHFGGHTDGPNWPYFIAFAKKYFH